MLAGLFVTGVRLPTDDATLWGLVLFLLASPGVAVPHRLARYGEQFDAIGSTCSVSEVEPAGWNVWLTRATRTALLAGAFWLLGGPLLV